MANTQTLENIAKLLPQSEREQFLAMIAQFKTVPDDDEYLQILLAIGFMTMLWKEVPNEIREILEGANPITDTCHSVAKQVREAVIDAIPSYDDLILITKRLEEHELSLRRTATPNNRSSTARPILVFIASLLGTSISIILFHYFNYLLP